MQYNWRRCNGSSYFSNYPCLIQYGQCAACKKLYFIWHLQITLIRIRDMCRVAARLPDLQRPAIECLGQLLMEARGDLGKRACFTTGVRALTCRE